MRRRLTFRTILNGNYAPAFLGGGRSPQSGPQSGHGTSSTVVYMSRKVDSFTPLVALKDVHIRCQPVCKRSWSKFLLQFSFWKNSNSSRTAESLSGLCANSARTGSWDNHQLDIRDITSHTGIVYSRIASTNRSLINMSPAFGVKLGKRPVLVGSLSAVERHHLKGEMSTLFTVDS